MSRRIKYNNPQIIQRETQSLARLVRSIFTSLAIPSLMTACAPVPHIDPGSGHISGGSGRTILYVGSGGKHADTEGQAEATEGALPSQGGVSLAEQYGPPAPSFPPAGKLISKHRAFRDAQFSAKWHSSAFGKLRTSQTASLNPSPMVKMPKDGIWDRVRKHLMLTAYEHESIQAEVDKIKRSPGILNFISKRAEPFLFYVVDEIDRRGLPMDLAMVPMVESADQARALGRTVYPLNIGQPDLPTP